MGDGGEVTRASQVLEIIRKRVAEIHPDVVFTQDTFADKYLRKMQEEMNNNVPSSKFSLNKVNIKGADSVTLFVNTQRFKVDKVEQEARQVLEQERRTKISFLTETRYVVLQATSKTSGEKMLLSSFHDKWKSGEKDELIRDFLTFMQLLAKKLKLKVILIGTDINREMKSFISGGSSQSISVFDFNYPDSCPSHCKRKSKPVIDYFLHSSANSPLHNSAKRFHEDEAILDHHPIHTVFQIGPGEEETVECGKEEVVTREVKKTPSKAAQRVSGKAKVFQPNPPRRLEASTANDIIPGLSLSKTICTSSDSKIQGGNSNGLPLPQVTQGRCTTQKDIIPGLSLKPTIGKDSKATKEVDTRIRAKGENKTSAHHTGGKMKQRGKGDIVPGILARNQKIESPIMQRAFSTKASSAELPNTSSESFSCELCRKSFSSRQGLFIHFGRQEKHFPCKEKNSKENSKEKNSKENSKKKNSKEICLRVFDTELKMSQHKESHK